MTVDRAMLINLKRREDKYWFAIGRLSVLDFDVRPYIDQVIRFIAHDGQDYPDAESVRQAAIADGFPEFADEGFKLFNRKHTAWCWTMRCALRRIVKMEPENVLLMLDDHLPKWTWTWHRFRLLLEMTQIMDPDHGFRLIQLIHTIKGDETSDWMKPKPHESVLQKGVCGIGDGALILNADGARLLLEIAAQPPFGDGFDVFESLAKRQDEAEIFYGLWHTIDDACEPNHEWESDL